MTKPPVPDLNQVFKDIEDSPSTEEYSYFDFARELSKRVPPSLRIYAEQHHWTGRHQYQGLINRLKDVKARADNSADEPRRLYVYFGTPEHFASTQAHFLELGRAWKGLVDLKIKFSPPGGAFEVIISPPGVHLE